MHEIFWLQKHRIGGRCGPFKINWSLTELKQNGIDSILTLGEGLCQPEEIAASGINHLILPLPDTVPPGPDDESLCKALLPKGLRFIIMELKRKRTVLIHCHSGKDRTCLMMAYFLSATTGISNILAMVEIQKIRSAAFESNGWAALSEKVIDSLTNEKGQSNPGIVYRGGSL